MNQEQKAEKERLQKLFGELMAQTFRNLIACHRLSRIRKLDEDQERLKRFLQEAVAKVLQASDLANKEKIKAMSHWLSKADLSSSEQVIAETLMMFSHAMMLRQMSP